MLKLITWVGFVLVAALLVGCSGATGQAVSQPLPTLAPHEASQLTIVTGQKVFVPAYSEIFYGSAEQVLALTATLAIHNTDLDHPIIIKSVRYFDTDGKLVRDFIDQPVQLKPMATTGFVINRDDTTGGWGANFTVEWGAETPVYEPVIEAVMVSNQGTEGVSFVSEGRVVSEQTP